MQPTSSPDTSLKPRYCHLVKDRTFGFHLTNDQNCDRPGQYVRQVAEGGVADVAGVKEGECDVIVVYDVIIVYDVTIAELQSLIWLKEVMSYFDVIITWVMGESQYN